jgi:hypothetical protein
MAQPGCHVLPWLPAFLALHSRLVLNRSGRAQSFSVRCSISYEVCEPRAAAVNEEA